FTLALVDVTIDADDAPVVIDGAVVAHAIVHDPAPALAGGIDNDRADLGRSGDRCLREPATFGLGFFCCSRHRGTSSRNLINGEGADGLGTLVAIVSSATRRRPAKKLRFWWRTIKLDLLAKIADPDLAPSGSKG